MSPKRRPRSTPALNPRTKAAIRPGELHQRFASYSHAQLVDLAIDLALDVNKLLAALEDAQ